MKRLLLLLALLAPLQARAQIEVKKVADPVTVVAKTNNLIGEFFEVVAIPVDTASIYVLSVQTTNRYDDWMQVWLGFTTEEALTSLDRINTLFDEKIGTSFELPLTTGTVTAKVQKNGTALFPTKKNRNGLYLSASGYAGGQVLTRTIIESLIKQTKQYGEEAND